MTGRTSLFPIALIGAALIACPSQARDPADAAARSVSYRDLDLADPEGRAALRKRVSEAAKRVCGLPSAGNHLPMQSACRRRAVAAVRMPPYASRAEMSLAAKSGALDQAPRR